MPRLVLNMSNTYQDVANQYNELDTNIMGGCVTVIVDGDNATRAQHCAGGFQALDPFILHGLGAVRTIVVVAPYYAGNDLERVLNWVRANKGNGQAGLVRSSHAHINMDSVRNGNLNNHVVRYL